MKRLAILLLLLVTGCTKIATGSIVTELRTDDIWILKSEGLQRHLQSKDFWDLNNVVHLHKRIAN